MSVQISIMGRSFEIAPFKLRDLRAAAPFIDEVNSTNGALTSVEGMAKASRAMIEVISIALVKSDPSMTADFIEENIEIVNIGAVGEAFKVILIEAGLAPKGEAAPPSAPVTEEADSAISSVDLSTS